MAEVVLAAVTKRYRDGVAVDAIDLHARDGELFVILGPSGCGKSTVLALIAGLETPDAGEIRLGGRIVNHVDPKDRNIAMVFQSYALYPHLSVRENLAFPLRIAKRDAATIARRVAWAAELLGLEALLDRKPDALSGGQRQRVAMGRALVREPAVFLLDEPLANLDSRLRHQMRAELARIHRTVSATMLYVTHDQVEAMTLADRLAVMRAGRVLQVGTPSSIYDTPRNLFVARFLGSPPMNLFTGRLEGGRLMLALGEVPVGGVARAAARTVVAGIRPEHLRVVSQARALPAVRARVVAVEWTGADVFASLAPAARAVELPKLAALDDDSREFVARLPGELRPTRDEMVLVELDPARLHLFDADTGERIDPNE